jgi:hypothetical protein
MERSVRSLTRVRFLTHQGKQVLFLDFTHCTPADIMDMMEEVERTVTAQPPNSVLTLSDFTGGRFSREAVQRMKEVATYNRPHVRRAAVVGVESFPKVFYTALQEFSAREFPGFNSREEALDWLVKD